MNIHYMFTPFSLFAVLKKSMQTGFLTVVDRMNGSHSPPMVTVKNNKANGHTTRTKFENMNMRATEMRDPDYPYRYRYSLKSLQSVPVPGSLSRERRSHPRVRAVRLDLLQTDRQYTTTETDEVARVSNFVSVFFRRRCVQNLFSLSCSVLY